MISVAIKIAIKTWEEARSHIDYYFAKSLKKAFTSLGCIAQIHIIPEWTNKNDELVLVIRGNTRYEPLPNQNSFLWILTNSKVTKEELDQFDCILIASETLKLQTVAPVYPLLPGTDLDTFYPDTEPLESGNIFIGDYTFGNTAEYFFRSQQDVKVYGQGWERTSEIPKSRVENKKIPISLLRKYYTNTTVLTDKADLVSHTIFDAAACGASVVVPKCEAVEKIFGNNILTFNPQHYKKEIPLILEKEINKEELLKIIKQNTFADRASVILDIIDQIY